MCDCVIPKEGFILLLGVGFARFLSFLGKLSVLVRVGLSLYEVCVSSVLVEFMLMQVEFSPHIEE